MMDIRKLSFLAMVCLLLTCIPSFAQEKPSLQTLFNESSSATKSKAKANASDDVIVIDLDEWQNEYDVTLNIATGKKYKFTNGELKWIGGDEPLVTVSNGSTVTFVSGVTVSGNDKRSDNDDKHRSPLIIIKDGNVVVDGATFYANTYRTSPVDYYSDVFCFEETSSTNGASGYLELYNCTAKGSVTNESQYGEIYMYGYGNHIDGGVRTNAEVSMDIRRNKVTPIYQNAKQSVNKAVRNIDSFLYSGIIDLASHGIINLRSSLSKADLCSILPYNNGGVILIFTDDGIIKVDADSYSDAPRKIAQGSNGYQISESDLEALQVKDLDAQKYELVLRDNAVYIQQKSITGQQWLQEQINSYVDITTDTDEQPGIITIPEEGIELTDGLLVPTGAFVKLVGGPITISKDFNPRPDMAISIYKGAHLFIDNTWDFNALPLKTFAYIFANNGHLSFGENSTLLNTWSETSRDGAFIHNSGRLDFNNPNSCAYKSEIRINGSFVDGGNHGTTEIRDGYIHTEKSAITAGNCYIYGGTIDCGEFAVKAVEFYLDGGFIAGDIDVKCAYLTKGSFHYTTSYIDFVIYSSGDVRDHTIVLKNYSNTGISSLELTSALTHKQRIKADWEKIDFSSPKVVVRGHFYQLTQQDCDNCVFDNLPSNVRAKLDGNTIVLTKEKKYLPDLFNEIEDGGTEDNPTNVMGDTDEVDTDKPEDLKDDLHILFGDPEDKEDGNESTKAFTLNIAGDYGIRIPATSSIEFKNINIDLGESSLNSFIEVYGKLIINVNVYIRNVCTCSKQVIYVRPGGTLIWRGGINSIPGVVIYNDGGTVIYEGGDTYGSIYGIHNVNGGKVIIKGGTIGGGEYAIYNPSNADIHIYDGCTIKGGIYSYGNITTGGGVGITTIYMPWNCRINLTSRITTNWFINILNVQNINVPTPFIYGTGGYKLTEEDLKRIKTNLPERYCLILDINVNIIYIVDCNALGIEGNVINAKNVVEKTYGIDGKLSESGHGMKIIRYSDGTTRKVILK